MKTTTRLMDVHLTPTPIDKIYRAKVKLQPNIFCPQWVGVRFEPNAERLPVYLRVFVTRIPTQIIINDAVHVKDSYFVDEFTNPNDPTGAIGLEQNSARLYAEWEETPAAMISLKRDMEAELSILEEQLIKASTDARNAEDEAIAKRNQLAEFEKVLASVTNYMDMQKSNDKLRNRQLDPNDEEAKKMQVAEDLINNRDRISKELTSNNRRAQRNAMDAEKKEWYLQEAIEEVRAQLEALERREAQINSKQLRFFWGTPGTEASVETRKGRGGRAKGKGSSIKRAHPSSPSPQQELPLFDIAMQPGMCEPEQPTSGNIEAGGKSKPSIIDNTQDIEH